MKNTTKHHLLIGDSTKANKILEMPNIDLLVTSPPYFNAPFDYDELFENYETFLEMMHNFAKLYFKALKPGGIVGLNIDDMLIKGVKYPIISDSIKIFTTNGYELRGKIIWKKPEGYIRISRRSGVLLQNPYPMYYYPDNLLECILVFQKPSQMKAKSEKMISLEDIWEMTNVLPLKGRLETDIAAFPDEL
ncbi:MAG: DNA methyltransferase, partial [Candidatus Hermodarchaeota archaeon]